MPFETPSFLCECDCLLVALAFHKENQLDGLKCKVYDVADAEGKNKCAGSGNVCERPEA